MFSVQINPTDLVNNTVCLRIWAFHCASESGCFLKGGGFVVYFLANLKKGFRTLKEAERVGIYFKTSQLPK